MNNLIIIAAAVFIGGGIGLCFGALQEAAARRNARLYSAGKFGSGWAAMPGSFRRIAYLLVAIALVQLLCPVFFSSAHQWWVSGGLVLGYGWMLLRQLRQRLAALNA